MDRGASQPEAMEQGGGGGLFWRIKFQWLTNNVNTVKIARTPHDVDVEYHGSYGTYAEENHEDNQHLDGLQVLLIGFDLSGDLRPVDLLHFLHRNS